MSTSDAAPLPRLGEVFFDVRSTSRSLRISWYADTGVAVLSIWQGQTCTGSFRLPMGELPRLIETLQRGPDGWAGPGEHPPQTGAGYVPQAGTGHGHPEGAAFPGYRVEQPPYPAQPGPAEYPGGFTHADSTAAPPGRPYASRQNATGPNASGQNIGGQNIGGHLSDPHPASPYANGTQPRDYSPEVSGIDYRQPEPPPYGHEQPGRTDEHAPPEWDSRVPVPAGNGLEPLPESFPYGLPRAGK